MDAASPPLPPDKADQAYVTVHALLAGGLWLPHKDVFQDSVNEPSEVGSEIPFIAFMVTHPTHGRSLFDLGMRKVRAYPARKRRLVLTAALCSTLKDGRLESRPPSMSIRCTSTATRISSTCLGRAA